MSGAEDESKPLEEVKFTQKEELLGDVSDPLYYYSNLFDVNKSLLKRIYNDYQKTGTSVKAPHHEVIFFCKTKFIDSGMFCRDTVDKSNGDSFFQIISSYVHKKYGGRN